MFKWISSVFSNIKLHTPRHLFNFFLLIFFFLFWQTQMWLHSLSLHNHINKSNFCKSMLIRNLLKHVMKYILTKPFHQNELMNPIWPFFFLGLKRKSSFHEKLTVYTCSWKCILKKEEEEVRLCWNTSV